MPPSVCHRGGTPVPAGQEGIHPGLEKFPAPEMSLRGEKLNIHITYLSPSVAPTLFSYRCLILPKPMLSTNLALIDGMWRFLYIGIVEL